MKNLKELDDQKSKKKQIEKLNRLSAEFKSQQIETRRILDRLERLIQHENK